MLQSTSPAQFIQDHFYYSIDFFHLLFLVLILVSFSCCFSYTFNFHRPLHVTSSICELLAAVRKWICAKRSRSIISLTSDLLCFPGGRDRCMMIDHLLHHSSSSSTSTSSSLLTLNYSSSRYRSGNEALSLTCMATTNTNTTYGPAGDIHQSTGPVSTSGVPMSSLSTTHIITARKTFVAAITRPISKREYSECRICNTEVWGSNGKLKFH